MNITTKKTLLIKAKIVKQPQCVTGKLFKLSHIAVINSFNFAKKPIRLENDFIILML